MSALAINAVGAITPVGEDVPATVGSIFTEALDALLVKGADGRPVGAATPIPVTVKGIDRLAALGAVALRVATLGLVKGVEIGLIVCTPSEKDEPGLAGQASSFLARLAAESDLAIAPRASRVFGPGRGAIIEALLYARTALQARDLPAVCVLGVDSLVTKARLGKVLRSKSVPVEQFIPGEAAAAILLNCRTGPDSLAILAGIGTAEEPSLGAKPDPPNLGKGINLAIDRAVADARLPKAVFAALVHDLPATQAGFEELAWVKGCPSLRTSPEIHIVSPTFSVGETGAASGVLSLVTLAFLIEKRVVGEPGLCLFTSEAAHRGVAILVPPPHRRAARK